MTACVNDNGWTLVKLIAIFENELKKIVHVMSVQVDVASPYIPVIFGLFNNPGSWSWNAMVFILTKEVLFIDSIIFEIF